MREKAPSLEREMSPIMPDKLEISDAHLPEASATRKTVFKMRNLKSSDLLSLMVGDLRKLRTTAKSHFGVRVLVL